MGGFFDLLRTAAQGYAAEAQERDNYVNSMSRGFDLLPESYKASCGMKLAVKRLIYLVIDIAIAVGIYYLLFKFYSAEKIVGIVILLLPVYLIINHFFLFLRFLTGGFDLFGGYVLKKNYFQVRDSRYRYSNGKLKSGHKNDGADAGYNKHYYANINGVEIRITESQYRSLRLDRYYFIARKKGKYIENDEYFFLDADPSIGDQRKGNHYPKDEGRRERAPKRGAFGNFLIALGILGVGMGVLMMKLTEGIEMGPEDNLGTMYLILYGGGGAFLLLGILFNAKRR